MFSLEEQLDRALKILQEAISMAEQSVPHFSDNDIRSLKDSWATIKIQRIKHFPPKREPLSLRGSVSRFSFRPSNRENLYNISSILGKSCERPASML